METATTLERLQHWGCQLKRGDETRDPIGRPSGAWYLDGVAEYLDRYVDEEQVLDASHDEMVAAINTVDAGEFMLEREAGETHLDWRGYNLGNSGWACNVKLHDVWKYRRFWDPIIDAVDAEEDMIIDWWDIIEHEWDWFIGDINENYPYLDPSAFMRGGRGGWLLYTRHELGVDEADQLVKLYTETIPPILDYLCRTIATYEAGLILADALDLSFEGHEEEKVFLDGITIEVTYPKPDDETDS